MNIDDLRRLAEQAAANGQSWLTADDFAGFGEVDTAYLIAANPQAILALLDERNRAYAEGMSDGRLVESATRKAAERRVAALERAGHDLLRALDAMQHHPNRNDDVAWAILMGGAGAAGEFRALLTVSDKSPTRQKLTELTRLSEDLPGGYAPSEHDHYHGKDDHWHTDPAALPAEADRQREVDRQTQVLIDGWSEASDE